MAEMIEIHVCQCLRGDNGSGVWIEGRYLGWLGEFYSLYGSIRLEMENCILFALSRHYRLKGV